MTKSYKPLITNIFWVLILLVNLSGYLPAQYSPDNPAPLKEWTFLVYLDGDNDLEESALTDFIEMSSIGTNNDVNIVVLMDRISGFSTRYDNWTGARMGYVQPLDTPTNSWGQSLGELNMGDPQNLKDFVSWGTASFPSNRTALVLWNHGNGWADYYVSLSAAYSYSMDLPLSKQPEPAKAICQDVTSQDDLTLAEIRIALEELRSEELIYIDLFGMDACLMAMIEVAAEFKDVADYFVASPAEEPIDGWPYDTILQDLQINPLMSTAQLGSTIVNRYYQYYNSGETQVAVDLSQLDNLLTQVDSLSYNLINNYQEGPELCISSAEDVLTAFNDVIIAEKHGVNFQGAHGLSVNFPSFGPESDYHSGHLTFLEYTSWENFLASYTALDTDSWVRDAKAYTMQYEPEWEYFDLFSFCQGVIENAPVGLDVIPSDDFVFFGEPGGPFSQYSTTYQLVNPSDVSIDWQVTSPVPWLVISPTSGTILPTTSQEITISVEPSETASTSEGVYTSNIEIINNYGTNNYITVLLALGVTDHLTELFSGTGDNNFDLEYKTITFIPTDITNSGDSAGGANSGGAGSGEASAPEGEGYIAPSINYGNTTGQAGEEYLSAILSSAAPGTISDAAEDTGTGEYSSADANAEYISGYYTACIQDAAVFDIDPAICTEIYLADDDSLEIALEGAYLPFFGQLYDSVHIGSNGYLTFNSGDIEYTETISAHYKLPRISAFFDDLAPISGETRFSYLVDDEKIVVTYENIGDLTDDTVQTGDQNTFQVQIFFNGIIKITWLEMETKDALVGLSNGIMPEDYLESNLDRYQQCQQDSPMAPIALDSQIPITQAMPRNIVLSAYDDDLPQGLTYFITELPIIGSLFQGETEITTTPYILGANNIVTYYQDSQDSGYDSFSWYANDGSSDSNIATSTIEILPLINYFTESMLADESDLSGLSVTFTPDDSESRYSACIDTLYSLPNDPNENDRILNDTSVNNDDEYYHCFLTDGKQVFLYGNAWNSFYVSANGYITFGEGTTDYQFTILEHFNMPRISMFYTDLNPDYGGAIYFQQLADRVVVTYDEVRERSSTATYTFQVELLFNGVIRIHWLDVSANAQKAGVGLSEGLGVPATFVESDISASDSCMTNNPIALDSTVETWAGQSVPVLLQAQYANEYVITTLPVNGTLHVGQIEIDSVPFGLAEDNIVLYTADRNAPAYDQFQWYCYNSSSDMMTVSNTATVEVQVHGCDVILEPEPVMPVDGNVCTQLNLPLMWDVPVQQNKSGVTYSGTRSVELQQSILVKKLSSESSQKGTPTVSALPTKAFIDIPGAKVNVLMFVKYSNNFPGGEVENTLNAISQYYTDFSVTLTDQEDPIVLEQMLESHQVFLIPEQQSTIVSTAASLGDSWSEMLNDYVERGGIVIACDFIWGAYELMNSAGLMQVQSSEQSILLNEQLDLAVNDIITDGIEQAFVSHAGTVSYDSADGEVLVSHQGSPVAVVSYQGHGLALLLGWDYYSYDDNYARIIANAVRLGAADYNYNIYLDTVNPPQNMVAQDYNFKIYDPGVLVPNQRYYWRVEASNKCGDFVTGPVWTFTTTNSMTDFDGNCKVDMLDMSYLAENWLNSDCSASWFRCDGTDTDRSGDVGFTDLAELAGEWLNSN